MAVDRNSSSMMIIIIAVIALVLVVLYSLMNAPDRRSPGEKLGDAVSELSDGAEDAGRALQNRTPAERLEDTADDAGDEVRRVFE